MRTIIKPSTDDYQKLIELWEASVRATHHFLDENDIQVYKKLIGDKYLETLNLFCIRTERGISGFIGLHDDLIQMLFVHPEHMNQGIGKLLVNFAIKEHNVTEVDVNEQNIFALEFYKRMGFVAFDRFENDDAGKPFPILSLSLKV